MNTYIAQLLAEHELTYTAIKELVLIHYNEWVSTAQIEDILFS